MKRPPKRLALLLRLMPTWSAYAFLLASPPPCARPWVGFAFGVWPILLVFEPSRAFTLRETAAVAVD